VANIIGNPISGGSNIIRNKSRCCNPNWQIAIDQTFKKRLAKSAEINRLWEKAIKRQLKKGNFSADCSSTILKKNGRRISFYEVEVKQNVPIFLPYITVPTIKNRKTQINSSGQLLVKPARNVKKETLGKSPYGCSGVY